MHHPTLAVLQHLRLTSPALLVGTALLAAALTGCATSPAPAAADAAATTHAGTATTAPGATSGATSGTTPGTTPVVDPITGEPIVGDGYIGYYGMWQVRFNSAADAAQYASLPAGKRAVVAAAQVLAAKRIPNGTCPLTGAKLTAAAAPVKVDDSIVGFASVADANQFKSLPKKKQEQVIAAWKAAANG